ncbi:hypothetical protein ACVGV4_02420, partial [Enterobacter hormaechei]
AKADAGRDGAYSVAGAGVNNAWWARAAPRPPRNKQPHPIPSPRAGPPAQTHTTQQKQKKTIIFFRQRKKKITKKKKKKIN